MSSGDGWIGFDLDGTLAFYDEWRGPTHIGEPILPMVNLVKEFLKEGKEVKIFTARVWALTLLDWDMTAQNSAAFHEAVEAELAIRKWCKEYIGQELPVTCMKYFNMIQLFDDRAVGVEKNTGRPIMDGDNSTYFGEPPRMRDFI